MYCFSKVSADASIGDWLVSMVSSGASGDYNHAHQLR